MDSTTTARKPGITLEDVRAALADTHPGELSAASLRERLGRGSLETIHRHLKALREERSPQAKTLDASVPPPNEGVVRTLWAAAWLAASQDSLRRIESLSMERDSALACVRTLEADFSSVALAHDAVLQTCEEQRVEFGAEISKLNETTSSASAERAQLLDRLDKADSQIQRLQTEAEHIVALAERDAALKDRAHQMDREHLLNQLAELKSALHTLQQRTPASAPSTCL